MLDFLLEYSFVNLKCLLLPPYLENACPLVLSNLYANVLQKISIIAIKYVLIFLIFQYKSL